MKNSLGGVYPQGKSIFGLIKGDTRSLDYSADNGSKGFLNGGPLGIRFPKSISKTYQMRKF